MRLVYLGFAAASLLAMLAPNIELFVAARMLQGIGNAFITPMMLAGLADITAPHGGDIIFITSAPAMRADGLILAIGAGASLLVRPRVKGPAPQGT